MYPVDTPFDIPDSWEWVRFKDLVDYSMGKTPPRKETEYWSNGTLPWVSIADLVADGTVTATKECVNSFAAENTFKGKISKAGTLLMSFKLTVGKVSILGIDAFHNEAIISIYPYVDPDKITTMFLFATSPLLSQSGNTKLSIKGNTLNSDSLNWKSPFLSSLYKRGHCLPSVTSQTRLLLFNKCLWLHKQKIKFHHSSERSAINLTSLTASAS